MFNININLEFLKIDHPMPIHLPHQTENFEISFVLFLKQKKFLNCRDLVDKFDGWSVKWKNVSTKYSLSNLNVFFWLKCSQNPIFENFIGETIFRKFI
jgi:hypothetical protein